jgi:hypothetical protein
MTAEKPRCPYCGKENEVRTFAELYAFELHSSPKGLSLNPFNLFTTSADNGNNNSDPTVDLLGGCLVGIVDFITIPLRGWYAAKTAPQRARRERERKAERLRWRETLAAWPPIYACKRDRTAFLPAEGRGAPTLSVYRMLQDQRDGAAVTKLLKGL